MTPIDPVQVIPSTRKASTAPPYVDEDPNISLVEQGLEVAEDETRDAVADAYEASALRNGSEDATDAMNDIDYVEAEDSSEAPELAAMHEESIPLEDED
ncbi:hypothetical protein [Haloferula sp. BvORR071]|uniref:hypothetical protein n=1 Tax=Haloferula sp. BvORR071 TaxID=1396141 RepID=UPI0005591612|nr:hypothetical protein [Haloferula sp. BvORR071]